jgi:hypothetical protein
MNNVQMNSPLFDFHNDYVGDRKTPIHPLSFESAVDEYNDDDDDLKPLLLVDGNSRDSKKAKQLLNNGIFLGEIVYVTEDSTGRMKVAILSFSLFTTLMSFWMLDSVKDPILAVCNTLPGNSVAWYERKILYSSFHEWCTALL